MFAIGQKVTILAPIPSIDDWHIFEGQFGEVVSANQRECKVRLQKATSIQKDVLFWNEELQANLNDS